MTTLTMISFVSFPPLLFGNSVVFFSLQILSHFPSCYLQAFLGGLGLQDDKDKSAAQGIELGGRDSRLALAWLVGVNKSRVLDSEQIPGRLHALAAFHTRNDMAVHSFAFSLRARKKTGQGIHMAVFPAFLGTTA